MMKYMMTTKSYSGEIHFESDMLPIYVGRTIDTENLEPGHRTDFELIYRENKKDDYGFYKAVTKFVKDIIKTGGYRDEVVESVRVDSVEVKRVYKFYPEVNLK